MGLGVRRRPVRSHDVPDDLVEFRPADWPGRTVEQQFSFWREARMTWASEHGWLGGAVDLIIGNYDARRRMTGAPAIERFPVDPIFVGPERFRASNGER
jgi:hypothetical protein